MKPSLGVDLGGTWLRACLAGSHGKILRQARLPKVPWPELAPALDRLRRRWRVRRFGRLIVGARGVWKRSERRELARRLAGLADAVQVMSDLELAHAAAFGGGPGILVVAGTGSAAYGQDARGRARRAGGLGPLLGDEGSAFWVGRRALKDPRLARRFPDGLALRLAHAQDPVRETARLARSVFRWALTDSAARAVQEEAARELARLAGGLARELDWRGPAPVAWHGSLFDDPRFLRRFAAAARRLGLDPRPPCTAPPETTAALFLV